MLCGSCTAVIKDATFSTFSAINILSRVGDLGLQILHGDFQSLLDALERGCGLCHRLFHSLLSSSKKSVIFADASSLHDAVDASTFRVRGRFAYETKDRSVVSFLWVVQATKEDGKERRETASEFLFASEDQRELGVSLGLDATNDVDSRAMYVLDRWLGECDASHAHCQARRPASVTPFARILDLGDSETGLHLRVVPAHELPRGIRYMTLTHCWGEDVTAIPTLTTARYAECMWGIDIAILPKTFQDAIRLTRRLGVRYLWIDSLCILQDSHDDWLMQASVMGDVYTGSFLNIAATKSSDPSGGLFAERNPAMLEPLRISFIEENQQLVSPEARKGPRVLSLEGTSTLLCQWTLSPEACARSIVDLDQVLGNKDGSFDLDGQNFSHAARSLELKGEILHAELLSSAGRWKPDTIDVRSHLSSRAGINSPGIRLAWQGGTRVSLEISSSDDLSEAVRIDLNEKLGNHNGSFSTDGQAFSHSARNLRLVDSTLHAELRMVSGEWRSSSIELDGVVLPTTNLAMTDIPELVTVRKRRYYDVGWAPYTKWAKSVAGAKLSLRGWVMQERLLPSRVVHFARDQLYWDCMQSRRLEERPDEEIDLSLPVARTTRLDFKSLDIFAPLQALEPCPLRVNYIWSSFKAMFGRSGTQFRKTDLASNAALAVDFGRKCDGDAQWLRTHPLIQTWSNIITSYSAAQLTFQGDRLVAIAGLASILSRQTGIRYIAGLWEHQLPRQLLWDFIFVGDSTVPMTDVAPSWSWASQIGHVGSRGLQLDSILESKGAMDLIKILGFTSATRTDTNDKRAILEPDTRLQIRGRLLPISLNMHAWPKGGSHKDGLVPYWSASTSLRPSGDTFLVPVLFVRWSSRLPTATPNCLIVESTSEKGTFRRIGTARLDSAYPLNHIVPQLYLTRIETFEDEDDDAISDDEGIDLDIQAATTMSTAAKAVLSPQQQLSDQRSAHAASPQMSQALKSLQAELTAKRLKGQKASPEHQVLVRAQTAWNDIGSMLSGHVDRMAGTPTKPVQFDVAGIQAALQKSMPDTVVAPVVTRSRRWEKNWPVIKLEPKEAIASHFYKEYVEDEDTPRLGPFVFDLV